MASPTDPPQDFSDNPYQPASTPKSKKGGNTVLIIFAVIGILGTVGVVACCGLGGAGFYAAMNVISSEVQTLVADDPVVQEKIGDIQSTKLNMGFTTKVQEDEGKRTFVFDIEGSNGSGTLTAKLETDAPGRPEIIWAQLEVDGEIYDLPSFGERD